MSDELYAGFEGKTCPIEPMLRTTCHKCGKPTNPDPAMNMGRMAWCDTCRWLLREPDYPHARHSVVPPPPAVLRELGLYVTFDEKQLLERIPNDNQVELWPELQPAPQAADVAADDVMARLFGRSA